MTREWSENTTLNAVAQNASAEVIVEATTVNGQASALPDFTATDFSNTAIDGGSLQSAGAEQVDMINGTIQNPGQVIAYPTSLSGSAFTDFYASGLGSAVAAALDGPGGHLYSYSAPGLGSTGDSLMPGTSPAIAELSNGSYEIAYQSTSGDLMVFNSGIVTNTGLPVRSGTSPAIAAVAGGGYETAIQENTSAFTVWGTAGNVQTNLSMDSGTSPAIAG